MLQLRDHSIIEGHRGEFEQNAAFDRGSSKLRWPDSRHNSIPSTALDMQPYPMPEEERDLREELSYLAGLYIGIGAQMGLKLRSGRDWDRDGESSDNFFDDYFHIEIDE